MMRILWEKNKDGFDQDGLWRGQLNYENLVGIQNHHLYMDNTKYIL